MKEGKKSGIPREEERGLEDEGSGGGKEDESMKREQVT